jgi:phosphatidylglycerol:prolipoprotein diacylglycerol transferase
MYGVCLLVGLFLATVLGERLCKNNHLDTQSYWQMVFYALVFGLAGARLYHVVHRSDYFSRHPLEILAVWQGGLGIWGGILGGLLGTVLVARTLRAVYGNLAEYLDVFAVVAPLAQAVSRWGNFFNAELFGYPTSLPWGIYIAQEVRPLAFRYYEYFHPLVLYESLACFALFGLLYKGYSRRRVMGLKLRPGSILVLYLMGYALIRFLLEFARPDPWRLGGLPVASIVSAAVFCCLLFYVGYAYLSSSHGSP